MGTKNRPDKIPDKINFHYLKTPNYRVYHVDGIFGGLTPNLSNLHMDLYIERHPVPKEETFGLDENGKLLKNKVTHKGKKGLIRNIECGLVMNIQTMKALHEWLGTKLKEYDNINKKIKEVQKIGKNEEVSKNE